MTDLDRVNHWNTAAVVGAGVMAFFLPFELFLFSYAILGPLHYLTEISWLHDRNYFSHGRFAAATLLLLALAAAHSRQLGLTGWTFFHDPIMTAFFAAVAFAFLRDPFLRWIAVSACFWFAKPLNGEFTFPFFGIYLATLVHVFCFTWAFMVYGALKARSPSGFLSLLIFSLVAIAMLALPALPTRESSAYVTHAIHAFGRLHLEFTQWLGWDAQSPKATIAMRFIAFAYTHHYLNWFFKTKLIGWHEVGKHRALGIAGFYVAFVGLYVYDYRVGLQALMFISVGHVFLEFPLNFKTFWGIGDELVRMTRRQARNEVRSSFKEKKRRAG